MGIFFTSSQMLRSKYLHAFPPQPAQQGVLPAMGPLYPVTAAGPSERIEHSVQWFPLPPLPLEAAPLTVAALSFRITEFRGIGAPLPYSVVLCHLDSEAELLGP